MLRYPFQIIESLRRVTENFTATRNARIAHERKFSSLFDATNLDDLGNGGARQALLVHGCDVMPVSAKNMRAAIADIFVELELQERGSIGTST